MAQNDEKVGEAMDRNEVVVMCERIALRLGNDEGEYRVYRDKRSQIRRALHGRSLEVVIFPPFTGATTGNPAILVNEAGRLFRWHGEMNNALEHINKLYTRPDGKKS